MISSFQLLSFNDRANLFLKIYSHILEPPLSTIIAKMVQTLSSLITFPTFPSLVVLVNIFINITRYLFNSKFCMITLHMLQ